MNLSQRQELLNVIQDFEGKDFESVFIKKYADTATIDSIQVQDYSVAELLALSKKAVGQLKTRVSIDDWQILPITQNLNEFGNCNIISVIKNITNRLMSSDYLNAIISIKALVYYEMLNGFWYLPKKIELGIRESSLKKLEERALVMMFHIEERQNKTNQLIDEIAILKDTLNQYLKDKLGEFELLKQNQGQSNMILTEIGNINSDAAAELKKITAVRDQCDNIIEKLREEQSSIVVQQNEIDKRNDAIKQTNEKLRSDVEAEADSVKQIYETTEKYKTEVSKMMGFIADGTLGHSFHQRKKETINSMGWWITGTIVSLVALVVWVTIVFTCLSANTGNVWADIIINALKSSPIAFLFAYALKQISKERKILEEYAYRESVALTLTAYLEQFENEDNDDKKNLLSQTVEKLYAKPVMTDTDPSASININSKDFTEMISKLAEAIKVIKK